MVPSFDAANAWVETQLSHASGPASFALLAAGGALASLLPCVYPLYPITVSILRQRSSRLGRHAHPLAYYAGLVAVYAALGVVAALSGGAFNALLRLPAANLVIGSALFALALATVGTLHFPMVGSSLEPADRGLLGTTLMGAGAGLLSSACVGPVVVSVLVGIAASADAVTAGVVLAAAAKMLAFGAGVGLPILAIGVFGVALPRGGRWMVAVQWAFGLLIAYFAFGYVGKGLAAAGLREPAASAAIGGALLLLAASYLLQSREAPVPERTRNALLVLAGAAGFLVMARAVLPAAQAAPPEAAAGDAAGATERHGNLTWYLDEDAAYAAAALAGKPVFVDFYGDWCSNCKAFDALTQSDRALNAALQKAVLLKIYDTSPAFARYREDPRFPELRVGLPFLLITSPDRSVLFKTSDYTRTEDMVLFLDG